VWFVEIAAASRENARRAAVKLENLLAEITAGCVAARALRRRCHAVAILSLVSAYVANAA
jgi:hypothetical protein